MASKAQVMLEGEEASVGKVVKVAEGAEADSDLCREARFASERERRATA